MTSRSTQEVSLSQVCVYMLLYGVIGFSFLGAAPRTIDMFGLSGGAIYTVLIVTVSGLLQFFTGMPDKAGVKIYAFLWAFLIYDAVGFIALPYNIFVIQDFVVWVGGAVLALMAYNLARKGLVNSEAVVRVYCWGGAILATVLFLFAVIGKEDAVNSLVAIPVMGMFFASTRRKKQMGVK